MTAMLNVPPAGGMRVGGTAGARRILYELARIPYSAPKKGAGSQWDKLWDSITGYRRE
jgi:hypothetical protein